MQRTSGGVGGMSAAASVAVPFVSVRVLTSKDEEAVAMVCVESSMRALATSGRVRARTIDVTELCDECAFADTDVLLITGGEPRRLRSLIGGAGATAIRTFIRNGGGYVGVCAGAVLATRKAPTLDLAPDVRCVDDNVWWTSGLCGKVILRQPLHSGSSPEVESLRASFGDFARYESGPLLAIDPPKQRRKKPSRRERELLVDGSDGEDDIVLATEPLALFDSDVHPWRPDSSASRQPSKGDMSGAVAALSSRHGIGRVVISSVHPELSKHKSDALLLENMCLFAARSPISIQAALEQPASGTHKKQSCPRCGHRTSKTSCRKCGADFAVAVERDSSSDVSSER